MNKICTEILKYWGNPSYIGLSNIQYYLNIKYPEMDERTRNSIYDCMSEILNIDVRTIDTIDHDAYDDDITDYEFVN